MEYIIWLLGLLTPYGGYSYLAMFGLLVACGFGLPVPEDIILISGGILSARGICDIYAVNIICFAGVMIGDGTVFAIGHVMGNSVRKTAFFSYILTPERHAAVERIIAKYGDKVIFVARFLPGLRTPIFLSAGIYKVKYSTFILLDGFAALISVPVWIYVGYLFGDNLELLEAKMKEFQYGMFGVVAGVLILLIAGYFIKKKLFTIE